MDIKISEEREEILSKVRVEFSERQENRGV